MYMHVTYILHIFFIIVIEISFSSYTLIFYLHSAITWYYKYYKIKYDIYT